jgi:hypothetical protein
LSGPEVFLESLWNERNPAGASDSGIPKLRLLDRQQQMTSASITPILSVEFLSETAKGKSTALPDHLSS